MSTSGKALIFLCLLAGACGQNAPPRIAALVNREVAVGSTLELIVTASDPDGDKLRFGVDGKPERASFVETVLGGRFQWTPLASDVPSGEASRTYPVTFFADDGRGGRDAETVLITVTRGAPGEGAPRFTSPADFVLDLAVSSTLDVTIAVQDDDSSTVTLTLVDAPQGVELAAFGPKSAELTWTPTVAQLAAQSLYLLRISADDGVHEPVVQDVSVLLRHKTGAACPGLPPTIRHEALGDQRRPGPYAVPATIADPDGVIRAATLYWSRQPNPSTADFESVAMLRDGASGDLYAGSIPDLGLASGQSATVTYFVCATDDDDHSGDACDHVTCLPADTQRFSFVAQVGTSGCTDDSAEPNDSASAATALTSGTPRTGLRQCGGNDDWFKVTLAAGDVLEAGLSFTESAGILDLAAFAPDGTSSVATAPNTVGVNERKLHLTAGAAGTYYLRVSSPVGTATSYDVSVTSRAGSSCTEDRYEPNDTAVGAATVGVGVQQNLRVCAGNDDWFKVALRAGDALDVSIAFTSSLGDLDLEVYRPDRTTVLGKSDGITDTESVSFRVVPESGFYYLRVHGYRGAQNGYALTVAGARCLNDSLEPNETQATARLVTAGTQRSLALCAGDNDWYKVSLTAGQHLHVLVRFKHAQGDLDLRVLRPDGSELASSLGIVDNEEIDVTAVPVTGAYFLRVYSATGAQNAYDLEVTVSGP